jgi:DNA mismatch repair protein MutS
VSLPLTTPAAAASADSATDELVSLLDPRPREAPPPRPDRARGASREPPPAGLSEPDYFRDLNLRQPAAALSEDVEGDWLATVFYSPVRDPEVVRYRQEVFRDLEDAELFERIRRFRDWMSDVERHLVRLKEMEDPRQREAWFLDAVWIYSKAVGELGDALTAGRPRSRGLRALADALESYRAGADFERLSSDAGRVREALGAIEYCVRIKGGWVEVSRYHGQGDYRAEIEDTFARFRQGRVNDYRVERRFPPYLGGLGSKILELVARLFPDAFDDLAGFCQRHDPFVAPQVLQAHFELGFYAAWLDYIDPIRSSGLAFCYPDVTGSAGAFAAEDTFDVVLAWKLVGEGRQVVTNNFRLDGPERIFVVSGPNQGGKTTFARTFGQLHHLGFLGYPVAGSSASLQPFDRIFTHFEREEAPADLRGKLEDDLVRARAILEEATDRSIVILNEAFASTTFDDARFLGEQIMRKMIDRQLRAVFVTFVDELASMGPAVVSLVSTVAPEDPSKRTLRLLRAPADGLAYALAIAEKYGLTYERLKEVLGR